MKVTRVNEATVFEVGTISWAIRRHLRDLTFRSIPIDAHLEIARMHGRIAARLQSPPACVVNNMSRLFGAGEASALARRNVAFMKTLYLARVLPELPAFYDAHRWSVEGLEHIDSALEKGNGVILVTAHLGYPRLIAPILRTLGYEAVQVVSGRVDRLERVRHMEEALRECAGLKRYLYGRLKSRRRRPNDIVAGLDARPIFSALARNSTVVFAGEGMRAHGFEILSLLGREFPFPTGYMKIAMATGSSVLPAFALPGPAGNRIRVRIDAELPVDPQAHVSENLEGYILALENQLRRTPELWTRWRIDDLFGKSMKWLEAPLEQRYSALWDQ